MRAGCGNTRKNAGKSRQMRVAWKVWVYGDSVEQIGLMSAELLQRRFQGLVR